MALNAYLLLDGVIGEGTLGGINANSWSWGMTNSGDVSGQGLSVQTFTIQTQIGRHSSVIMQDLQTQPGRVGNFYIFPNNNVHAPHWTAEFQFQGILFESYQVGGDNVDALQEEFTFSFTSVVVNMPQGDIVNVIIPIPGT
jgi:hypothetical protein